MRHLKHFATIVLLGSAAARGQPVDLVPVVAKQSSRTVELPGELLPFQSVALHARISGYVERVLGDRGSSVRKGELLIELSAPELRTQIAEAETKVLAAEADRLQAEAQLAAAESTYGRLKKAAETPGAIAGNELVITENQVAAVRALIASRQQAVGAARAAVQTHKEMETYLRIAAPFEGVVTERLVHPGALAGPATGPMLVIQQIAQLRLVVALPESYAGAIARGAAVPFRVPAFAGRTFTGTVSRVSRAVDPKTRTMPVELDVLNRDLALAPGMYASVKWPLQSPGPVLFVPRTSVVTTTERTFVIRDRDGRAEWVDVKRGAAEGDLVEVLGSLKPGDRVVRRGTDEIREGAALTR